MKVNWRNFPIPEPFVAALLGGGLLQRFFPVAIHPGSPIGWMAGAFLMLAGVVLTIWTIIIVGESEVEKSTSLITHGPYVLSRNPMYLAWLIFVIGLTLVVNSAWLVIGTFLAWIYLNIKTIPEEERSLQHRFGEMYEIYRLKVRRWL